MPSLEGFAQVDGRNVYGLTILRDRAARDDDPLLAEDLRDLAVRERLEPILRADQLLDQRANRGRRAGAARVGGDMAAKEVLELENAARRGHVLLGRHARHGRLVQAERI